MLTALRKHLGADAGVVAAVPNVMHGKIRLGFLAGRSPAGLLSPAATPPSHWCDGAALQQTFELAGFVITRIERHTEAFDADIQPIHGTPLPSALVDELRRDDAAAGRSLSWRTFPLAAHVRLDMRVRELTQSHDRCGGADEGTRTAGGRPRQSLRRTEARVRWRCVRIDRIGADVQQVAGRDSRLQPALTPLINA